jgi:TrmH family RNA methyltransferase
MRLDSPRNPRVRAALALRDRAERERTGATLVDGVRELTRAIDADVEVLESFVDPGRLAVTGPDLLDRLRRGHGLVHEAGPEVLSRLAYGDRSEGVVAVVRVPDTSLARLQPGPDPLYVVVEGVEKPGNLGAILRSADAVGADAVIAADPMTDPFNPNAIRASLGTIFSVPVASAGTGAVRAWLAARGIRVLAARVDGGDVFDGVDLRGPLAIALGSEAAGLTDAWRDPSVTAVRLPMYGAADSLNVSVAAAVLLYEARRQRGAPGPGRRTGDAIT